MSAAQVRIASLAEQKRELTRKMEGYEAEILEAPQVERGLVTLMRDHDNARKKYEEIRAKEMGAKITESLEQENKAERFVLLEPPCCLRSRSSLTARKSLRWAWCWHRPVAVRW